MNWSNSNTYFDGYKFAFESFCQQLFERVILRKYADEVTQLVILDGAEGGGGVEAYAELKANKIIGLQARVAREDDRQIVPFVDRDSLTKSLK